MSSFEQFRAPNTKISVYTYGTCSGTPPLGGWGIVFLLNEKEEVTLSGIVENSNSTTAQIMAIIQALEKLPNQAVATIYLECQYIKDALTLWLPKWRINGWKTADKKAIKNQELWQKIDQLLTSHQSISFSWLDRNNLPAFYGKAEAVAKSAIIAYQSEKIILAQPNPITSLQSFASQAAIAPRTDLVERDTSIEVEILSMEEFLKTTKGRPLTIYTDGACSGNPGPGGWGAILLSDHYEVTLSGGEPKTTNNRMEIKASIEALKALPPGLSINLFTDSVYLKNGVTKWMINWKKNGWKTADKKPVSNQDLWEELDGYVAKHTIEWHWVRGHDNNPLNDKADSLAKSAILAFKMR